MRSRRHVPVRVGHLPCNAEKAERFSEPLKALHVTGHHRCCRPLASCMMLKPFRVSPRNTAPSQGSLHAPPAVLCCAVPQPLPVALPPCHIPAATTPMSRHPYGQPFVKVITTHTLYFYGVPLWLFMPSVACHAVPGHVQRSWKFLENASSPAPQCHPSCTATFLRACGQRSLLGRVCRVGNPSHLSGLACLTYTLP